MVLGGWVQAVLCVGQRVRLRLQQHQQNLLAGGSSLHDEDLASPLGGSATQLLSERSEWRIHFQQTVKFKKIFDQQLPGLCQAFRRMQTELQEMLDRVDAKEEWIQEQFGETVSVSGAFGASPLSWTLEDDLSGAVILLRRIHCSEVASSREHRSTTVPLLPAICSCPGAERETSERSLVFLMVHGRSMPCELLVSSPPCPLRSVWIAYLLTSTPARRAPRFS